MIRVIIILLMLSIPLQGLPVEEVNAATSRVAIIKEMKGTVKVKKSGGSKEFTAFVKMTLNEGDILKTGDNSSATLQFSNGGTEDDKITTSENTTMIFSKLSNRKGTTTKISLFNGSAWIDVKSIHSKNDEFSLNTQTAIMGVRGTHLFVGIDPQTGETQTIVVAGVVNMKGKDATAAESKNIYPGQAALITTNERSGTEISIAPLGIARFVNHSSKEVMRAIFESAGEIQEENKEDIKKYEERGFPANLGHSAEDHARFKSNTESLLGALADEALRSGVLTQSTLDQMMLEIVTQTGVIVDLTKKSIEWNHEEKNHKVDQVDHDKEEFKKKDKKEVKKDNKATDKKNVEKNR